MLDHLSERDRPAVKRKLRAAWKLTDHKAATLGAGERVAAHELVRGSVGLFRDATIVVRRPSDGFVAGHEFLEPRDHVR